MWRCVILFIRIRAHYVGEEVRELKIWGKHEFSTDPDFNTRGRGFTLRSSCKKQRGLNFNTLCSPDQMQNHRKTIMTSLLTNYMRTLIQLGKACDKQFVYSKTLDMF